MVDIHVKTLLSCLTCRQEGRGNAKAKYADEGSHSSYVPKPKVPVLNQPFLEHTIANFKKYGIESFILAVSYLPEAIQNYFRGGAESGIQR